MTDAVRQKVIHAACSAMQPETAEARVMEALRVCESIALERAMIATAKAQASNEYAARIAGLVQRHAELQASCPHYSLTVRPNPGGPSCWTCDICGADLAKPPN